LPNIVKPILPQLHSKILIRTYNKIHPMTHKDHMKWVKTLPKNIYAGQSITNNQHSMSLPEVVIQGLATNLDSGL